MQAIAVTSLSVGETVPTDLYDSKGILFLPAGHVVRAIDMTINRDRIASGLFTAPSPDSDNVLIPPADETEPTPVQGNADSSANQTLTVSDLRVGQALQGDIVDANGLLLLAGGAVITERFIERLKARGVHEVTERSANSDEEVSNPTPTTPAPSPVSRKARTHASVGRNGNSHQFGQQIASISTRTAPLEDLQRYIKGGQHVFEDAVSDVKIIVDDLVDGRLKCCSGLEDVVYSLANSISADAGLAMLLMRYKTEAPDYLYQHCVNTSMVAMRVAAQMHHSESELMDIGMGALLQDIGMLRVPDDIRFSDRNLTADERTQVQHHPNYGAAILADMTGLSATIPTIVFQTHERADGSGYPRRRSGMFIHPLARILGAVDTYVALTEDRSYRPARHPHHAMINVLGQAKQGRFDKDVIRGMLESISLYPVGSFVSLSNEKTAKVIRSNPEQFARPVVALVNPDGSLVDRELDLAKRPRTQIVGPVPAPNQPAS